MSCNLRTLVLLGSLSACAWGADNDPGPLILTGDVERFYATYDAAAGQPAASDLQHYVDAGSAGLRDFAVLRKISGDSLADAIAKKPKLFAGARRCSAVLPKVRTRVDAALARLQQLYPRTVLPPITILIGRGSSGGTTSPAGVLIGLEVVCAAEYMAPNLEDRFVQVISHEYAHVQQPASGESDAAITLLYASLREGVADFVSELICGSVAYPQLHMWIQGREAEIEQRFMRERNGTNLGAWLYNGPGTAADPGDLGYWAGYRVAKGYYAGAKDKSKALAELIEATPASAERIFMKSGVGQR